jgi:serine/threonine protein kinase
VYDSVRVVLSDVTTRYELERELGRGGMGTVYRARDRTTGEVVAIKVLRRRLVRDLLRFSREVAVLADLVHPGVVRYLGHGHLPNGKPALIMEWVEGETLTQRMTTRGLSVSDTVIAFARIADALGFAHAHGIVHRDIKPDNLLFTGDDFTHVKVIDFGIARRIDDVINLTRTGTRIGTPRYMSPEQARGQREVDTRVDVFALGCVLYECLTSVRPFDGANAQAVLFKVLVTDEASLDVLCPEAPAALVSLVTRMMSKDPAGRPADAGEVARALAALGDVPHGPVRRSAIDDAPYMSSTGLETSLQRPPRGSDQPTFLLLMVPPEGEAELDADDDTLEDTARDNLIAALRREVAADGLRVEVLANGSVLGLMSSSEKPEDVATRLAQCALRVKRWAPDVSVAFLSDRGAADANATLGGTLERGFANLEIAATKAVTLVQHGEAGLVHLDERTARLLEDRFTIVRGDGGFQLVAGGDA